MTQERFDVAADMQFMMRAVGQIDAVLACARYAHLQQDALDAAVDAASRLCAGVLAPLNRSGDRIGASYDGGNVSTPPGFVQAFAAFSHAGLNGVSADESAGGMGLPKLLGACVEELTAGANLAFSLCPVLNKGAAAALARFGSAYHKEVVLPRLVSGEWTGTMNLTESQAGSDLGAIRALAEPHGDHFAIRGEKIFITYGDHDFTPNVVHLVLARMAGAPRGSKGLSLFLVPKFLFDANGVLGPRNGVRCRSIEHKLGIHASPTCVMTFGGEDIAHGWLVGEQGQGLEAMFTMMNEARYAVGIEGVAQCQTAYSVAVHYAAQRVQGRPAGSKSDSLPICHHPDVARQLLRARSFAEGGRALALWIGGQFDLAEAHPDADVRSAARAKAELAVPLLKGWATERATDAANAAIQVHGGLGYIEESGVPQILRDARITSIYEGTTGIQANDLCFRKLPRDAGGSFSQVLSELRLVCAQSEQSGDESLRRLATPLALALTSASDCAQWVVSEAGCRPARVAAGAVAALELLAGTLVAGLLVQAASYAERTGDQIKRRSKTALAAFFIHHELPRAQAALPAITACADAILESIPDVSHV